MKIKSFAWSIGVLAVVLSSFVAGSPAADKDEKPFRVSLRLPQDAQLGASPDQIFRAIAPSSSDAWKPKAAEEKPRGPAADLYPKVAPAVVIVRAGEGHGTGAIIDPAGWIITNHHVIADAEVDPVSGAQRAVIYRGRLDGGFMRLIDDGIPALVYKASEEKDLALLKLVRLPDGMKNLPSVKLA